MPAGTATSGSRDRRLPSAPLREEVLRLHGDPDYPITLEVTLFEPPGPGPFPLAVMNHGADQASLGHRGERYRFTISAYYFLSKGYAVVLPMMRGFADSGGGIEHEGCDLGKVARRNGDDIAGVIDALSARPEIDRTRIIVAGQSFGGWNTLGLGTKPPPGVRGLIAFNPAIRSSDCQNQDRSMAEGAAELARHTTLPSLWFFGDNDTIMPVATWRAMYDSYKQAGGRAELVDVGLVGSDSHQMLSSSDSLPLWTPKVDAFLYRIGMNSTTVDPEFLPHPAPAATHWAALSDVSAIPYMTDAGRALYQKFLVSPLPRAFVITPGGGASQASGGYDPVGFALQSCRQHSADCVFYAVNNDVVWVPRPTNESGATGVRQVRKTLQPNVATSLGAFFALNGDCTSRGVPVVKVSVFPLHGTVSVSEQQQHPHFAPNSPPAACNTSLVAGRDVTYTPASAFAGDDNLTLVETDLEGRQHTLQFAITVR